MTEAEWLASEDPAAMLAWHGRTPCEGESSDGKRYEMRGISDRKLRLFACACARQVWSLLGADCRDAVEAGERRADDDSAEGRKVRGIAFNAADRLQGRQQLLAYGCLRANAANGAAEAALFAMRLGSSAATQAALLRDIVGNPWRPVRLSWLEDRAGGDRLRVFSPWLTPTVLSLAQAAYEERERKCSCWGFGTDGRPMPAVFCPDCKGAGRIDDGTLDPARLAILADALEEAGCDSEDLLLHLRRPATCAACNSTGEGVDEYTGSVIISGGCPRCRGNVGPHVRGCWALDLILGKE